MVDSASQNNIDIEDFPVINVISDSVGITGQTVARATAAAFGIFDPIINVLPYINDGKTLKKVLDELIKKNKTVKENKRFQPIVLFYTLIDIKNKKALENFIGQHKNYFVVCDIMSEPIKAISKAANINPNAKPGTFHSVNSYYFERIDAMEFTINHDDGRNPQDLTKADIVLLGVSRSSKTPLSIYLSQQGYKVANVPLDYETDPPKEIFDVDKNRIFGLMISPETLVDIRKRRIGRAKNIAPKYADLEYVYQDLDDAHKLMRKLGAIIIHTDNRAIEETSQEILRYYETNHPKKALKNG